MKKQMMILIGMMTIAMWSGNTNAQESYEYAKRGFYVGLTVPYNTIDGDFDGNEVLSNGVSAAIVPSIDGNFGWGVTIGGRFSRFSTELSYLRSNHDYEFGSYRDDADLNIIEFDFKYYLLTDTAVQPFLLGGLLFPWLTVNNGIVDMSTGALGDATYTGLGASLGGGLAVYPHPQVAIHGTALYRFITFSSLEDEEIDDNLSGSGLGFLAGVTFTF